MTQGSGNVVHAATTVKQFVASRATNPLTRGGSSGDDAGMATLQEWCEAEGMTPDDLAKAIGANRSTAYDLLAHRRLPARRLALAIHEASGGRVTSIDLAAYVAAQRHGGAATDER